MCNDAIERMAIDYHRDCVCRLRMLKRARTIIEKSNDYKTAIENLRQELLLDVDLDHLVSSIPSEIERIERCLGTMAETVDIARKVFFVNFFDSEKYFVFNQEICFSYVCKLHNDIGPKLHNFSNSPSRQEVVHAELEVAMHSPMILSDLDLFCYETMPDRDAMYPTRTQPRK